mgnify:FL=1
MNMRFLFISLMSLIGLCASAITVTSTPGTLSEAVGENINETLA